MVPESYSEIARASPSMVWRECIAPMKWEAWDPDVEQLSDITVPSPLLSSSPGKEEQECVTGTKFVFDMKDGAKIPATLTHVEENKVLTYQGKLLGGTIVIDSTILLEELPASDNAPTSTNITYTFGITGWLGPVVNYLKAQVITDGMKHGLANMIQLSEKLEGGTCSK